MPTSPNRKKWVFLILLAIILLRGTTLFTSLIDDEETFALFGRVILHGGIPYVDIIDNKPPLLYYWYAFFLWLFGDTNITAIHVVAMVWVALTCWVIYVIGRRVYSDYAGYFAALCYAIFTTTYIPPYVATHAALILALPFCLSVHLLFKWYDDGRVRWLLLSGMMSAIAAFVKYQALLQIPYVMWAFIYLIYSRCHPGTTDTTCRTAISRSVIKGCIAYLLGVGIIAAAVLGTLYYYNCFHAFYTHTWQSSFSYMKEGETIGDFWRRALIWAGSYIVSTLLLWVTLINQLFKRLVKYLYGQPIERPYSTLMWGWFFFNIPAVLAGGRFYPHYFIQLLPPVCIIAGTQLSRWWYDTPDEGLLHRRHKRIVITVIFIVSALLWVPPRIFYQKICDRFHFHNLKVEHKIGEYIKIHSPEGYKIFVWGIDPAIYFLSGRDPATRFLWSDSLTGRLPGVPETQRGPLDTQTLIHQGDWPVFLSDLEKNPPIYIVDCASGNLRDYAKFPIQNYPAFFKIVQIHYRPETTIDGVTLYRRAIGH